jgi:hypothetical protein
MTWLAFAMLAIGLLMIVFGWRGRRIGQSPTCQWCGFDLSGAYPSALLCPECGAGLYAKHGRTPVRLGRVRRRWWLASLGVVLGIVACYVIALGVPARINMAGVVRYEPSWLLGRQAASADPSIADPSLSELSARLTAKSLSPSSIRFLADQALDAQADPARSWYAAAKGRPAWANVFEDAFKSGSRTPAQLERFARQGYSPAMICASAVQRGHPLTIGLTHRNTRVFPTRPMAYSLQFTRIVVDGKVLLEHPADMQTSGAGMSPEDPTSDWVGLSQSVVVDPGHEGPVQMEVTVQACLFDGAGGRAAVTLLGSWPVTLHAQLNVVSPETELTSLSTDASLRDRVRSLVTPRTPIRIFNDGRAQYGWNAIDFDNSPVPLGFDAFFRVGDREWPAGPLFAPKGWRGVVSYGGREFPVQGLEGDSVDLVLRPSRAAAENIPGDHGTIWGEEVVIPGLKVQRIDQGQAGSGRAQ